jgi:hypothetical protein
VVYVQYDGERVPTGAWTRILGFGKIVAILLPTEKTLKGPLPKAAARPTDSSASPLISAAKMINK